MKKALEVLIADDDDAILGLLDSVFRERRERFEVVALCSDGEVALAECRRLQPDVVLLDVRMPKLDGIQVCRTIRGELPLAVILMISALGEEEYVRSAIAAGAGDYIVKPFRIDALLEVLNRELELLETQAEALESKPGKGQKLSRVWAFWSPRSGVGVTSLAINTALELVRANQPTLFLDLDLVFPDSEQLLGLTGMRNMSDLIRESGELEVETARGFMETHPSGLRCLYQHSPESSVKVTARHVQALIHGIGSQYRFVVLDLPADMGERVGVALEAADTIWLVAGPDPVQARNITKALGLFHRLGYSRDKVKLLANGISPKREGLIRSLLPGEPHEVLPADEAVFTEAVKTASPAVLTAPSSAFSRVLRRMVSASLGLVTADEAHGSSLKARFLKLLGR